MLVLLVIFMATAPLFTPGLIKPPTVAEGTPVVREVVGTLVEYDTNGVITVTDPRGNQEIFTDPKEAVEYLKAGCILHPERTIGVTGDPKQFHQIVIGLFAQLRSERCNVGLQVKHE